MKEIPTEEIIKKINPNFINLKEFENQEQFEKMLLLRYPFSFQFSPIYPYIVGTASIGTFIASRLHTNSNNYKGSLIATLSSAAFAVSFFSYHNDLKSISANACDIGYMGLTGYIIHLSYNTLQLSDPIYKRINQISKGFLLFMTGITISYDLFGRFGYLIKIAEKNEKNKLNKKEILNDLSNVKTQINNNEIINNNDIDNNNQQK
eukprot:TRINITY_DN2129_c0_g1_i3.p1 TRINITY_DN2129_c0_g1~~TRINITY_DN2129_c0_g1_i3.p1  ORF type:complete len:206 (-),score=76.84 TRINITY_DN2129_c0_g1_i3:16-633(-)